MNAAPLEYNGKCYKYVNERNGYTGYRYEHGDEIIKKPDGTVLEDVSLSTEWAAITSGE